MATHEERQQAARWLDKAMEFHRSSMAACLVGGGLIVAALLEAASPWVGACVLGMAGVGYGVGELYTRAARRVLNSAYRPRR